MQTTAILALIVPRLMPVGRSATTQYRLGMSTYIPRASTVKANRSPSRSQMVLVANGVDSLGTMKSSEMHAENPTRCCKRRVAKREIEKKINALI
jgi:hypothetical protein